MNKSNNHENADHETQAFDDSDIGHSRHNNDAYKRFVDRVKKTNHKSVKSGNKDSGFVSPSTKLEPLSQEELAFFSDQHPDSDDFQDLMSPTVDTSIGSKPIPIRPKAARTARAVNRSMSTKVSSLKLLVLGVVFGLLLSGVMVSIMYTTGILSALTNTISQTGTEIATNNARKSAADNTPSTDSDEKGATAGNESTGNSAQDNKDKQGNITYEAFREEAKTTLYRETDNK